MDPPAERPPTLPRVRAVVAYVDRLTHQRALRIHDHLEEELRGEFVLDFTWWTPDLLRHPAQFESAVAAAVEADAIVFSFHAAQDLPAPVRSWIDAWRHKRERRRSALVAVSAPPAWTPHAAGLCPVHRLLEEVAEQAGMEFHPHLFPPSAEVPCCLVDAGFEQAAQLTALIDEILAHRPSQSAWGLNE
jgi:hypothetical protein